MRRHREALIRESGNLPREEDDTSVKDSRTGNGIKKLPTTSFTDVVIIYLGGEMISQKIKSGRAVFAIVMAALVITLMLPFYSFAGALYEDGSYDVDVTCVKANTGKPGKGGVESAKLIVENGEITKIEAKMSSGAYTYAKLCPPDDPNVANATKYEAVQDPADGKSVITVPYQGKLKDIDFTAQTTKMSEPYEIGYKLTLTPKADFVRALHLGDEVTLKPGIYKAINSEKLTEGNKMFRSVQAYLVVNEDGSAVLDMFLSGSGYDALYLGDKLLDMPDGAAAKENPNGLWGSDKISLEESVVGQKALTDEGETKLHFTISLDKLYQKISAGAHSAKYDQWTFKLLNFDAANFEFVKALPEEPGGQEPDEPNPPVVTPEATYNFIKGSGQAWNEGLNAEWEKGSDKGLDFRVDAPFDEFFGIKLDGKMVANENYTVEEGSTLIHLKKDYLDTLETGDHTLTAMYENGKEVTAKFSVAAVPAADKTANTVKNGNKNQAPNTGDDLNLPAYMIILAGAASALIVAGVKKHAEK
jgi:hypothetical protein